MADNETVTLSFVRDKETKNTVRYAEEGDENLVGSIYLAKRLAKNAIQVKVTIEVVK